VTTFFFILFIISSFVAIPNQFEKLKNMSLFVPDSEKSLIYVKEMEIRKRDTITSIRKLLHSRKPIMNNYVKRLYVTSVLLEKNTYF
jgi:hypothetical protein